MKKYFTTDIEIKTAVLEGLKLNHGYCPCIINSYGEPDYKCPCKEFREIIPVNEYCYCGLYKKGEE